MFDQKKYYFIILFSVIGTILASFLVVFFWGEYFFDSWYLNKVDLEGDENSARIVIQSPEKVVVEQDLRIKDVVEQVKPSMAVIYRKKQSGKDIISQIYQKDDLIGYGVIITSDGWVASAARTDDLDAKQIVVDYNGQIKEVVKKTNDEASGIVFFQIKAVDLPVVKFGSLDDSSVGEQILIINQAEVILTNIADLHFARDNEILHSSEKYYDYFLLKERNLASGSAVVNFQGNLIGLTIENNQILNEAAPIEYLQKSIGAVLRGEAVKTPYLGAHFLDLAANVGLNEQVLKGLNYGALVYGRGSQRAVNSDSPLLGLITEGDIITKINNQEINSQTSLTELILNKKSGEVIDIEYVREKGKVEKIEVKLK